MVHVVVERKHDQVVIETLLADLSLKHSFDVHVAGGRDAGRPLARKILVLQEQPVAFVFDTDTSDPSSSADLEQSLHSYFNLRAPGPPFLLVAMAPTIDILLADHPQTIEKRLGRRLSAAERVAARFEPRGFLRAHLKDLGVPEVTDLFRSLNKTDLETLRKDKRIVKLRGFIEKQSASSQKKRRAG